MKVRILMVILLISAAFQVIQAEKLKIGAYSYPPFMIKDNASGIYHEIIQAIALESGAEFNWMYLPYARLNSYFDRGRIQIEVGSSALWTKKRPVPGFYTRSFYTLEDVIVFAPGKRIRYHKPADLWGKRVGIVRGYSFPQFSQAFRQRTIIRHEATDEAQLLRMLSKGRIDQAFMSKDLILYWKKLKPAYRKFEVGAVVGSYKVGIRVHPNKKNIIPRLNKAIVAIKKRGEIKRIVRKYR